MAPGPKTVLGFFFGAIKSIFLLFYTHLLSPLIFPRQQIRDETPSPTSYSSTTSAPRTTATPETSPEPRDDDDDEERNKGVENLYETLPERVAGDDDLEDEGATASDAENASGEFPRQRRMAVKKKMLKSRSSAMDLIVAQGSSNGRRSLWEELPEVKETGILGIPC